VLLIGVTLSLGGLVTAAAVSQFGLQSNSASVAGSVADASAGKLVSLVYATVAPGSGGCSTIYQGTADGTSFTVVLFDYGNAKFAPATIVVNSTQYSGPYVALQPGGMAQYSLTLGGCAHPSGQTLLIEDLTGDEVQVET
jgi:hypothetical protein